MKSVALIFKDGNYILLDYLHLRHLNCYSFYILFLFGSLFIWDDSCPVCLQVQIWIVVNQVQLLNISSSNSNNNTVISCQVRMGLFCLAEHRHRNKPVPFPKHLNDFTIELRAQFLLSERLICRREATFLKISPTSSFFFQCPSFNFLGFVSGIVSFFNFLTFSYWFFLPPVDLSLPPTQFFVHPLHYWA